MSFDKLQAYPSSLRSALSESAKKWESSSDMIPLLSTLFTQEQLQALIRRKLDECKSEKDTCILRRAFLCTASLTEIIPQSVVTDIISFLPSAQYAMLPVLSSSITNVVNSSHSLFRNVCSCTIVSDGPKIDYKLLCGGQISLSHLALGRKYI